MPNFTELFADDSKKSTPVLPTNALFAEINKGGNVTSHLKKVSDDQKTHKTSTLRTTSVASSTTGTGRVGYTITKRRWLALYQL